MNTYLAPAFVACFALMGCTPGAATGESDTSLPVDTPAMKYTQVDPPNAEGFSKVTAGESGTHAEGVVNANGVEIIPPRTSFLVNDISGSTALVQNGASFLFVDLANGPVEATLFSTENGYEYAEPFRHGRALVKRDDRFFYIDTLGKALFQETYDFAETFHEERALVMNNGTYRIIAPEGRTVARLDYDQVGPQSPWCWQVVRIKNDVYWSGFVDLNGKEITPLIYDEVGYYDPEVKRIRVGKGGMYGFLDEHAQVAIPIIHEEAEIFDHGKARVMLKGRNFYIDPSGKEVTE